LVGIQGIPGLSGPAGLPGMLASRYPYLNTSSQTT
jgi:hypothetical protein